MWGHQLEMRRPRQRSLHRLEVNRACPREYQCSGTVAVHDGVSDAVFGHGEKAVALTQRHLPWMALKCGCAQDRRVASVISV